MPESLLTIQLFGPFEARLNGRVLQLEKRDSGRLLAYLILNQQPVVQRTLEETFWPGNLRDSYLKAIGQLRKELGSESDRLEQVGQCLGFEVAGCEIDYIHFREGHRSTDTTHLHEVLTESERGLLLGWDGSWIKAARIQLASEQSILFWRLAQMLLHERSYAKAIPILRRCCQSRPSEERAWKALIQALLSEGERLQALEEIEHYENLLSSKNLPLPAELRELRNALWSGQETSTDPQCIPLTAGGAVPLGAAYYVEREADQLLKDAIRLHPGLIHIKGSQQTGKSSLLARGMQQARHLGMRTLFTNFGLLTNADLSSLENFSWRTIGLLHGQLAREEYRKPIPTPSAMATPLQQLEEFLHDEILESSPTPVLWAMDGLDRLFDSPYYEEFFLLLRSWHEARSTQPLMAWRCLTLLLACATEPQLYIRDANNSPFNVGERIVVSDFLPRETERFFAGTTLQKLTAIERTMLTQLVGGHPYLLARSLVEMRKSAVSIEELVHCAQEPDGPFGDHLRRLSQFVANDSALAEGIRQVLAKNQCPTPVFFRLRSGGILSGTVEDCHFRTPLYRLWFQSGAY